MLRLRDDRIGNASVFCQELQHPLTKLDVLLITEDITFRIIGDGHLQLLDLISQTLHLFIFRQFPDFRHQLMGFVSQRRTTLLTEREVVKGMANRANDSATRTTALRTESLMTCQMGATERADVSSDIMATRLTEIGIGLHGCATVRAGGHADSIATGGAEEGLRLINGSAMRTHDTTGRFHLHRLLGKWLFRAHSC